MKRGLLALLTIVTVVLSRMLYARYAAPLRKGDFSGLSDYELMMFTLAANPNSALVQSASIELMSRLADVEEQSPIEKMGTRQNTGDLLASWEASEANGVAK
jgi:hypothetical protein